MTLSLTPVFLFRFFLDPALSAGHRTLTGFVILALALTFTVTVFRALTFWSASISVRHIRFLLPVDGR